LKSVSTACALIFISLEEGEKLGTKPVFTQGVESEVDVATALTRARQARLPSPWTGRGIHEGRERESEKNERDWERHLISIF